MSIPTRSARGIELTELGLGGAQFGTLYQALPAAELEEAFEIAWSAGIRYIDTAPHYGVGLSEQRLGEYLRGRDGYVLSTKAGRRLVPNPDGEGKLDDDGFVVPATTVRRWDLSRDGIRRSLDESLTRMGLDSVDVLYLHDAENHWDAARAEAIPALIELRDEGVVRGVGAGMNFAGHLTELVRDFDVDLVMCAGRYTLLEQATELLDLAAARGVGVVAAAVYNSGLLANPRPAADARYDYAPVSSSNQPELIARVNMLADVCEAHGVTLPEAAVAFPLRHPAVVSVVVGAAGPQQVADAVDRYHRTIPEALWDDLSRVMEQP
jgi:D-threo-aldose 1-dehydrogenase